MKPKINPIIRLIQPRTRQKEENKLNTMYASRQVEDIIRDTKNMTTPMKSRAHLKIHHVSSPD